MAGGLEDDTTTTPKRQHKAPRENAHTSVLGMDGTDLLVPPTSSASLNARRSSPTRAETPFNGSKNSPIRNETPTTALEDLEQSQGSPHNSLGSNREDPMLPGGEFRGSRGSWWGKVWGGSYNQVDSLFSDDNGTPVHRGAATVEDQLRQDCHFFYQGFEDQPSPDPRRRFRPFSSTPNDHDPMRNNSREGALFHAKYQRLNQEIKDDHQNHDLALQEAGDHMHIRFNSESSINVLDVQHSSLFYKQNGKLLMKLPRDQMRLIMDNDLEPGIVSVEQWRRPEDQYQGSPAVSQMEMTPPLKYVLTVPDDLYRRVVSEMSYRLMPPCWGFFKCCHYHDETEHADIRLALVILAVTFALVFIFTMEWRTT